VSGHGGSHYAALAPLAPPDFVPRSAAGAGAGAGAGGAGSLGSFGDYPSFGAPSTGVPTGRGTATATGGSLGAGLFAPSAVTGAGAGAVTGAESLTGGPPMSVGGGLGARAQSPGLGTPVLSAVGGDALANGAGGIGDSGTPAPGGAGVPPLGAAPSHFSSSMPLLHSASTHSQQSHARGHAHGQAGLVGVGIGALGIGAGGLASGGFPEWR
jgi:hypothetical protein